MRSQLILNHKNQKEKMSLFFLILFFVFANNGFAVKPYQPQMSDPLLETWRWQKYPILEGKGFLWLQEDKNGFLWFRVDAGIYRYDGMTWTLFTKDTCHVGNIVTLLSLPDKSTVAIGSDGISKLVDEKWEVQLSFNGALKPFIHTAEIDHNGKIWIGTDVGILSTDLINRKAVFYTTHDFQTILQTIFPNFDVQLLPEMICIRDSWGTSTGIFALGDMVAAVASNSPAAIAGIAPGDSILKMDVLNFKSGLVTAPANSSLKITVKKKNGGAATHQLENKDLTNQFYQSFRSFINMIVDSQNKLWGLNFEPISTPPYRLLQLNIRNLTTNPQSAWRIFDEQDGISFNHDMDIIERNDHSIMVVSGYAKIPVYNYDGTQWHQFSPSEFVGGDDSHNHVLETKDGALWFGSFGKVIANINGNWKIYKSPEVPIPTTLVYLYETTNDHLWICGNKSDVLSLDYSKNRWQTYKNLNFYFESPDHTQWFLTVEGTVVSKKGDEWLEYSKEDGLIESVVGLNVSQNGNIWIYGSHNHSSAVACFDGVQWRRRVFPKISLGIDYRAFYETSDGKIYFGGLINSLPEKGHLAGVLQYDPAKGNFDTDAAWQHFPFAGGTFPEAPYGIGESADGTIWFGSIYGIHMYNGQSCRPVLDPELVRGKRIDIVKTTKENQLWFALRGYGALNYDGQNWFQYTMDDGLSNNTISDIHCASDGSVWVVTYKGISRFYNNEWTKHTLPLEIAFNRESGTIKESHNGSIWFNQNDRDWYRRVITNIVPSKENFPVFRTTCYKAETSPPETNITLCEKKVSQPGNAILSWSGQDLWGVTPKEKLNYSFRMDNGEWSKYSQETSRIFLALKSGKHVFEVRARDRDFNEDPNPARAEFTVIPPWYFQTVFIVIAIIVLTIIVGLTYYIIQKSMNLQRSNKALVSAKEEIEKHSREIEQHTMEVEKQTMEIEKQKAEVEEAYKKINYELEEREKAEKAFRESSEENKKLYTKMKAAVVQLEDGVKKVNDMAMDVAKGANQFKFTSRELARGASEQASSLTQIGTSLQEIAWTTSQSSNNSDNVKMLTDKTQDSTIKGLESMQKLSEAMNEIRQSAEETNKIINTINEIADQTNLLSLNAAIEAARAGESGRGFAVVADEVSKLASRSTDAVKNTTKMISAAVKSAEHGVSLNKELIQKFQDIQEHVNKVNDVMGEITSATQQQHHGIEQINHALEQTNQITTENASAAEQSASSAEQMDRSAKELQRLVNSFKAAIEDLAGERQHSSVKLEKEITVP